MLKEQGVGFREPDFFHCAIRAREIPLSEVVDKRYQYNKNHSQCRKCALFKILKAQEAKKGMEQGVVPKKLAPLEEAIKIKILFESAEVKNFFGSPKFEQGIELTRKQLKALDKDNRLLKRPTPSEQPEKIRYFFKLLREIAISPFGFHFKTTYHHFIIDPGFGTRISWSPGSKSLVKIENEAPLRDSIHKRYIYIPLVFHASKPLLAKWRDIAADATISLLCISAIKPTGRKKTITFPLLHFPQVRLTLFQRDIPVLQYFFIQDNFSGKTPIRFLEESLVIFFFLPVHRAQVVCPPRGKDAKKARLTRLIPSALFACRELVKKGEEDKKLKKRIEDIIMDEMIDKNLEGPYPHELILVHRAFSGAWEKFEHPGLLTNNPHDLLRRYVYKNKEKDGRVAHLIRNNLEWLISEWKCLYLSDEGAAARAFHLIP